MLLQTSTAQKNADAKYVDDGGLLLDLIRSAGAGLASRIESRWLAVSSHDPSDSLSKPGQVLIFIGPGNNGNDGLSAAEILVSKNIPVKVFRLSGFKKSDDKNAAVLEKNLALAGVAVSVIDSDVISSKYFSESVKNSACAVDCIFGSGFKTGRPLPDSFTALCSVLNENSPYTISADIPSGVSADTGETAEAFVNANETVTFGAPKPGHFILPGKAARGNLSVSPILIRDGFTGPDAPECFSREDKADVLSLLPKRNPIGNKYTNGRVLVIAGSKQFAGAGILAVSAALRGGSGLVTAAVPGSISPMITVACPESVRLPLGGTKTSFISEKHVEQLLDASAVFDSVVIGPGLGRSPGTVKAVIDFLKKTKCRKIVVDADGLFALSVYSSLCDKRCTSVPAFVQKYEGLFTKSELIHDVRDIFEGKDVVLTPHAGEAAKLLGLSSEEIDRSRLAAAKTISEKFGVVTLLKGNDTITYSPGRKLTVNNTGNSALSKGGSGDVLAGLIGALLAQGSSAYDGARVGAFIHGLTADILSETKTEFSVLPGDLAVAFREVMC